MTSERTDSTQQIEAKADSLSRRGVLAAGAIGLAALAATAGQVGANTQQPVPPASGRANPNGRFAGKVVLVTGATTGIGKATAYAFAREGARVFFNGRREQLGRENEAEIRAFGGDATYLRADVRDEAQVRATVDGCVQRYGRVDIAFNNAGIETRTPAPLADQQLSEWMDVLNTNATGTFLSMKYEIPHMLRQGGGVIVNNASVSAHVGFATIGPYSASKHAILSLTKVAALEYSDKNIRVNSIAPGAVDTPMLQRAARGFNLTYEQLAQDFPNKRIVTAEEMARVVMLLSSDEATAFIGSNVDVTGGYLAK